MRSNFWGKKPDGTLEVAPGCDIGCTISEAIRLSFKNLKRGVSFGFNGVIVRVLYNSRPDLIYRDWYRAISGYISGPVGPLPRKKLTPAEREHDAAVQRERDERNAIRQAEYDAKARAHAERVEAVLANVGPMEIADAEAWEATLAANPDGYGGAVVSYAERWARLMQGEIANGRAVGDVAKQTSHDADLEGITGFMYGCAVSILSKCWKHGEDLRRWHNLDTQIGNEGEKANDNGGVLNPAMLSVATA